MGMMCMGISCVFRGSKYLWPCLDGRGQDPLEGKEMKVLQPEVQGSKQGAWVIQRFRRCKIFTNIQQICEKIHITMIERACFQFRYAHECETLKATRQRDQVRNVSIFSLKWPLVLKPGNYAKICQTHTKATCEPKFLWVFILTKLNIDFVVQASSFTLSFCGMRLILFLKSLILIWQLWENKLTSCKSINTYLATHRYVNVLVFK